MKRTLLVALSFLLTAAPATAEAPRKDVVELMEVMKLKELAESSMKQMQDAFQSQYAQSMAASPNQAEAMKKMMERFRPITEKAMGWEVMKDEYARIYGETFTPDEVKGLITFYKTPAGQAYITKMPVLMQKVSEVSAVRMQQLMPEIQKTAMEISAESMGASGASK